jgi:putative secretion ATPase (PEP-CTERM system associated)
MYERFYNLRERPFSLTPDPDYLYPSRVHSEALAYLRCGIEGQAGFVIITGEIGSGKTTLLQTVLRGLDRQTSVARLVNTMLDAKELIEAIMLDFGLDPGAGRGKPLLLRDLARFLVDQRMSGRLSLLVIDEAQNLSMAALEEIRMLSNLETEKSKLVQIVLVGQPNLRDLLARPEMEQLRQRITVSYHLLPLGADETAAYVNHRLKRASIGTPLQFSDEVSAIVHQYSQGVPRTINVIADAILLFGYGEDRRVIDAELVRQVVQELEETNVIGAARVVAAEASAASTSFGRSSFETPDRTAVDWLTDGVTQPGESLVDRASPTQSHTHNAAAALADRERNLTAREGHLTARERHLAARENRLTSRQDELVAREGELAVREARIAEREQQLIEQRRLLVREYRLAHSASEESNARFAVPTAPWEPRSGDASLENGARPPLRRTRSGALKSEGVWTRLRRGVFGSAKPVFEE